MAVSNREEYEDVLGALGACVSLRIPALLWGDPGSGKTSVVESATDQGWHVETLIISHYEPSDFTGLPILVDGKLEFAPPSWAVRLHDNPGPSICFLDEFSTASPALQAAALRPLTHYIVGDLQLPNTVAFVAAANPADVAAAGWELAAPTASRFVHLDWGLPIEVYSECLVSGQWPAIPVGHLPDGYQVVLDRWRVLLTGFLRARQAQLSLIPKDAAARGRAFPTPRTWDYAVRLAAYSEAIGARSEVTRLLVQGCVGDLVAHEFITYARSQDLPDPEDVLANGFDFASVRPDRVYVVLQSVLAAVQRHPTSERWEQAVTACCMAAVQSGIDPAVPVVRALLRPGLRPPAARLPTQLRVFGPVLALAGLLPKDA